MIKTKIIKTLKIKQKKKLKLMIKKRQKKRGKQILFIKSVSYIFL